MALKASFVQQAAKDSNGLLFEDVDVARNTDAKATEGGKSCECSFVVARTPLLLKYPRCALNLLVKSDEPDVESSLYVVQPELWIASIEERAY